MAKGAYIGVDGIARKIKTGYVGVDGVARKIKKAYIGIGGVARPCWSDNGLEYYGNIPSLTTIRSGYASASTPKYAMFAGGQTSSSYTSTTVDFYTENLTHTSSYQHHGSTLSDGGALASYAIFAGGKSGTRVDDMKKAVTSISDTGTKKTLSELTEYKYGMGTATVGDYILFAGGYSTNGYYSDDYRKTVDTYNSSLTKGATKNLSTSRGYAAGVTVGNYALFCGGENKNGKITYVKAFNGNLTMSSATDLTLGNDSVIRPTAARAGNFAIVLAGTNSFNVYDENLTKTMLSATGTYDRNPSVTLDKYAIFTLGGSIPAVPIAFDDTLTQVEITSVGNLRTDLEEAAVIGNYAIFPYSTNGIVRAIKVNK